jgi:DNA invertase Pin-like site-specific DNA recombinase
LKQDLDYLREGDTLMMTRLDRLACSATHLRQKVKLTPEMRQAVQQSCGAGFPLTQLMNHCQLSKASVYRALMVNEEIA